MGLLPVRNEQRERTVQRLVSAEESSAKRIHSLDDEGLLCLHLGEGKVMNHWIALKSAWRAGLKQYRKRLTELRRGPVPKNLTFGAPTSGVSLIIGSEGSGAIAEPVSGVPIRGPADHSS